MNFNKYAPLSRSSYLNLPADIKKKHGCLNIENTDDACFAWSVVAALYPVNESKKKPQRPSSYSHYATVLKRKGMEFPIKISDISKFETLNKILINVYGVEYNIESKKNIVVGPLYFTKQKRDRHVNLLFIEHGEKAHYCLIKRLARLVSKSDE